MRRRTFLKTLASVAFARPLAAGAQEVAKAIGFEVPPTLLARADDVIE